MPKQRRVGLQKKVSSIFTGVPIPKDDGAQQSPGAPPPVPERPNYAPPSHLSSKTEKPQQPAQPTPKVAPAKQPKAVTTTKAAKQAPWQKTLEQIKTKLFTPKPGVSPARQKAMVILVPTLFLIMIFAFSRVLSGPSPGSAGAKTFGPSNTIAASKGEIDWQIPDTYPTTLRDPMQFGSVTTALNGTGNLIVKGIVYSKEKPSAVIDNQIVHEGEKVSGATVVKINKDSVELEMNGKRWTQKVQR
jgi:outer membrane biosynthesis protein TonB